MRKIFTLHLIILDLVLCQCKSTVNNDLEIYQSDRTNVICVHDDIKEIVLNEVLLSDQTKTYRIGKYIAIKDYRETNGFIHLFDIKSFKYIASFGQIGTGPSEFTSHGDIVYNPEDREIYVSDYGSYNILAFPEDSIIYGHNKSPYIKYSMDPNSFANKYFYINDTISYCKTVNPINISTYYECTGVLNMKTGSVKRFEYKHPEISMKKMSLALSYADNLYAECNVNYDLISLFNLKGELIKNIYGPQWGKTHLSCFGDATFTEDYLIAIYNGEEFEKHLPASRCIVFNKQGDYIATLELNYNIRSVLYIKESNNLLFSFDDVIQLGYLNLNDIHLERS